MSETGNERDQRRAIQSCAKSLDRIATALETIVARLDAVQAQRDQHHVETFVPDGTDRWGWQCFTCDHDTLAIFDTYEAAERSAEQHRADTAHRPVGHGAVLADDDGPDPVEARAFELVMKAGHADCVFGWYWQPDSGQVLCRGSATTHSSDEVLGTVTLDG